MGLLSPVSLLLLLPALSTAEVVQSFENKCPEFFANPNWQFSPPVISPSASYKMICQRYNNTYEFATLYDTSNKIPVYSSYVYVGRNACNRSNVWLIEPQLDDPAGDNNMASEATVKNIMLQATNKDYAGSGYDKGHLYPVFQTRFPCTADATFTLTNAAPQDPRFNRGKWRSLEKKISNFLIKNCSQNAAYVVTGVVPGQGNIGNRVNIPNYFWSAYCCLDNNKKPMFSAEGYIARNDNNTQIIGPIPVHKSGGTPGQYLDDILSDNNHYGTQFSVFGGKC